MNLKELEAFRIYFKDNNILLVDSESVGKVELPEVDWNFIEDDLVNGNIQGIKFTKE